MGINLPPGQSVLRIGHSGAEYLKANMPTSRTVPASAESALKTDPQDYPRKIYVFRGDGSGLYAFTADREGRALPSQLYPQISWRFEHEGSLRPDGSSSRDRILQAAIDGIAKRGFHLIHAALYGELLGFVWQDSGTLH
jgi:hypothetical protein